MNLSELLFHKDYIENDGSLILALGKNIAGKPIFTDLEKMENFIP